jgi:hypothetical protein
MPWRECDKSAGNGRAWLPKKSSPARSRRGAKTVLMWEQVSTRQRRLATTALLGLAPARSTRASAANHPESISACRPDDSVIANENVTVTDHACPQPCAPRGRRGEQKSSRNQGALSASS